MTEGNRAIIGNGESVDHMLKDRERLTAALGGDLPEEKRAEVAQRLAEVEARLEQIRQAIAAPAGQG